MTAMLVGTPLSQDDDRTTKLCYAAARSDVRSGLL